MVPGQKSPVGSNESYDWQECAIVNATFEVTSASFNGNAYGLVNLGYTTSNNPPNIFSDVLPYNAENVNPPFYPQNSPNDENLKYKTVVGTNTFIGPTIP